MFKKNRAYFNFVIKLLFIVFSLLIKMFSMGLFLLHKK